MEDCALIPMGGRAGRGTGAVRATYMELAPALGVSGVGDSPAKSAPPAVLVGAWA
jgi:hypothetical protein